MYLEDFKHGETHVTPTYVVTEKDILEFAEKFDPQEYHLNHDAAKNSVFGTLVSPGFQIAALAWTLALKTGLFDQCAVAGLGVDKLRWKKGVAASDAIHAEFTLKNVRDSNSYPGNGIAEFEYKVKNQHAEVVLEMVITKMLRKRPIK